MMSSLWFGIEIKNFLFQGFDVNSALGFISVCIFIAVFTILHEAIKMHQGLEKLKLKPLKVSPFLAGLLCTNRMERSILLERRSPVISEQTSLCQWNSLFLYACQLIVGYFLMLCVMTYNGFLIISIAVGAAIGHLLFGALLLHITAQAFLEKVSCNDCQVSTDGQTTPITERNDEFDNESLLEYHDASQNRSGCTSTISVQVHHA